MARQPLQVIVIPFRESENVGYQFAVFHRADDSMWQFIAGGAEDDETAEQTARREAEEEAGIPKRARFFGWIPVPPFQRRHSHQQTTGPRTSLSCLNTHLLLM